MNFLVNKNRFFGPNHSILMKSIGEVTNFPRLWDADNLNEFETGGFFKVHADLFAPIENTGRHESLVLSLVFLDDANSLKRAQLEAFATTALAQRTILGRTLDSQVDLYIMADRETHPELFSSAKLKGTVIIDYMDMAFEEAERFCIQKITEHTAAVDELTSTIEAYLSKGLKGFGKDSYSDLLSKICDDVHLYAKLPDILTQSGHPGAHSSFAQMVSTLPEKDRMIVNSTLLSLSSSEFVLNHELYRALGIQESKKNPPGTNLIKRGKLSTREAFAVLSNSHLSEFFKPLLETTPAEFASAASKIFASSFVKAVNNKAVIEQFEAQKDYRV